MTTVSQPDAPPDSPDLHVMLAEVQVALRASREREAALRSELEYRVRNALAITRSVFSRTMDNATSVEDVRDHFLGRLDALARYQGRLAVMPASIFDLETMVWDELMVFASGNDQRIEVTGPGVQLAQRAAEVIGLALHELATNSVKFGVLGDPASDRRLRITWKEQDGSILFEWVETGVPIVASAPIASGFGREFIEHGLPYQLGAETTFELLPGGLVCRMVIAPTDKPKLAS